jgi:15-cis-phytoene synthase
MLPIDFATPADLALCRQMIRQGSKSFHLASLLLPSRYRQQARCLYGFCRVADDLVDQAEDAKMAVALLSQRLDLIYAGRPGADPADRAFADVVRNFAVPRAVPDALIEGFLWDAENRSYETLSDVAAYAVRVAGTVGVMMSLIMGVRSPEALARAIDLGVAMQFSNIGRDVREDAGIGRVYLPSESLACDGVTREGVLRDPSLGAAAADRLVTEAETLYQRAASGIAYLPRRCRASINAARRLYREIGLQSVALRHQQRAVVSTQRKLWLVAAAVAETPRLRTAPPTPALPEAMFLMDAVAAARPSAQERSGLDAQIGWVMQVFESVEARKL